MSGLQYNRPRWPQCVQAASTQHHVVHMSSLNAIADIRSRPMERAFFGPVHGNLKQAGVSMAPAALGRCRATNSVCGTCSFWDCICNMHVQHRVHLECCPQKVQALHLHQGWMPFALVCYMQRPKGRDHKQAGLMR
jgi:hypothetical protein